MINVYTFKGSDGEEIHIANDSLEEANDQARETFEGAPFFLFSTEQKPCWDDFETKYKPRRMRRRGESETSIDPDDCSASDYFIEPCDIKEVEGFHELTTANHVWTVVDCDGSLWVTPGYHFVNRYVYIVTEKKWKDEKEQFMYA